MKEEAILDQSTLDRQKAKFIAQGGTIETVRVKLSGEVIDELRPKYKTREVDLWVKGDLNRLKEIKGE